MLPPYCLPADVAWEAALLLWRAAVAVARPQRPMAHGSAHVRCCLPIGPTRRQGPLLTRFGFTAISYSLWVGVTNGARAVEVNLADASVMSRMMVPGTCSLRSKSAGRS